MNYVVKPDIIAGCFKRLRSQKIHPHFAGYLCLRRSAAQAQRLDGLKPEFIEFHREFLGVPDSLPASPYIKPFVNQPPTKDNLWLNKNVAGSYAPSSLRGNQPFTKVIGVADDGKQYYLRANHAELALEYLLYKKQIQVADLAAFLYRDYALVGQNPTISDMIDVFMYEFGYNSEPGGDPNSEFTVLYSLDNVESFPQDWLDHHD
jgi:hypothetical protein